MNRIGVIISSCIVGLFLAGGASAQTAGTLIGQYEARQIGLQRMWFTQVDVDPGRGQLLHLTQHVSSTKAVTVHQIVYDGGRIVITERDLDRFGQVLGAEAAQKAATIKVSDLTNLKLNPKLETITVPQTTLYAATDAGVVQAIDAETGRTLWKVGIGVPGAPMEAVAASDEYVAAVNGSDLFLMKAETGDFVWKRRVRGSPGAGPVITSHMVFVPTVSGAMEAYEIGNIRSAPAIYRSQGRAMWQPVYTGVYVAWPTDRGHLYVADGEQNRINFRLEANDAIVAPAAVMHPGRIVVTSIDGFVYCLQELSGVVLWRFSSGEPILESPVVYGDTVYAVTTDGNLFAIDGELGQERWSRAGIARVRGASPTRLYCMTRTGGLVVLDRATGSQLGSLPTHSLDLPFTNKETDRVVLASRRGLVQSLREIQLEFPVIYAGLTKQEEKGAAGKPAKPADAPADEAPVDPFGTKAPAVDPFGAPAAPKGDEPKEDKKGEDPFSPFGD